MLSIRLAECFDSIQFKPICAALNDNSSAHIAIICAGSITYAVFFHLHSLLSVDKQN